MAGSGRAVQAFSLNAVSCPNPVEDFGDAECGYVIPATPGNTIGTGFDFCPRHLEACRERGDDEAARGLARKHPKRMNGFPSIQSGNP